MVVLPTPLTPTTNITKGFSHPSKLISPSLAASFFNNISCSASLRAAPSFKDFRSSCLVNSAIIFVVVSIPTSAIIKDVSSSSSKASSITLAPRNRLPIPSPVRESAERIRWPKDIFDWGSGNSSGSALDSSAVSVFRLKRSRKERFAGLGLLPLVDFDSI